MFIKYVVKMFVVNRISELLKMFIAGSCVQSFLVTRQLTKVLLEKQILGLKTNNLLDIARFSL